MGGASRTYWFFLVLRLKEVRIKNEQNDWPCPGRGLSERLVGVCDKLVASVRAEGLAGSLLSYLRCEMELGPLISFTSSDYGHLAPSTSLKRSGSVFLCFPREEKSKSSFVDLRLLFYYKPKGREKAILIVLSL